jgi:hypothetical protein
MRESVRSGRRANFYITENSFIDHYARDVGTTGVAVYHVLERHAHCETRSTWVGTAKMAELLGVDQRTIQRTIKKLESLRLIRIVKSANLTTYYVVPVPPPARIRSIPLFDEMSEPISDSLPEPGDTNVAAATPMSRQTTFTSPRTTPMSRHTTFMPPASDIHVTAYKDEQDSLNKTQQQDLFNKTSEQHNREIKKSAQRIIDILGLTDMSIAAATAAVKTKVSQTKLSMDGVVQEIVTAANHAERRGIEKQEFLDDFLAQSSARQILVNLNLPVTNNFIVTLTAAVKAEAKRTQLSLVEVAEFITNAASKDDSRGVSIDRFYFENCKWRSNVGFSKAERRKIDNLEANARVKQRLRERLQSI